MAGLIEQAAAQGSEQEDGEQEGGKINAQKIRAKIQVPSNLQQAYQRVVVAGGKFLFDPRTHELALKSLKEGDGPIGDRLGNGLAGLMSMLFQQSNKTIPPQIILPAAVDLLGQAAEFIQEAGVEPITAKDLARATVVMISSLTKMFGGDPSKFEQMAGGGGEGSEGQAHEMAPGDKAEDMREGEPPDEMNGPSQQEWDDEVKRRQQGV